MRARPNPSGDRLVQDYLSRVAAAARHLPKGGRVAFVGRTKAQVEKQVRAVGTDDPGRVMEVLAALGTPEDLVRAERLRIDGTWLAKRGHDADSVTARAAAPSKPRVQPRVHRRVNSRWKPATPPLPRKPAAAPLPRKPGPKPAAAPDGKKTGTANGSRLLRLAGPAPSTPAPSTPAPSTPAPSTPAPSTPAPAGPAAQHSSAQHAAYCASAGCPGRDDAPRPGSGRGRQRSPGRQTPLDGIWWQLARGHLLESVAVVLIGLGGAILPFPFWLAGVVVAVFSRLWDAKDKTIALTGPVLVDLLGSVVSALFMGGSQNAVAIYSHALHVDSGLWIRLGCVLTAVYLGWRVAQGRREKIPPWRR